MTGRHSRRRRFPLGLIAHRAYITLLTAWLAATGAVVLMAALGVR